MNFFAIPVFSFVPPKYKKLVDEKSGKVFGALLLCFILLALITAFRAVSGMGALKNAVIKECPDFDLSNGEFTIDKDYKYDNDGVYCLISDEIDTVSAADVEKVAKSGKNYDSIVIIGKKGAGSYNNREYQTIDFDDIKAFSLSKDKVVNTYLPALNIIIVAGCIIGAFFSIAIYYLMSLILQFITGAFSKGFFKRELNEKERFRITVLGKFPPYVLVWIINLFLPNPVFLVRLLIQLGFITLCLYFYTKSDGMQAYAGAQYPNQGQPYPGGQTYPGGGQQQYQSQQAYPGAQIYPGSQQPYPGGQQQYQSQQPYPGAQQPYQSQQPNPGQQSFDQQYYGGQPGQNFDQQ